MLAEIPVSQVLHHGGKQIGFMGYECPLHACLLHIYFSVGGLQCLVH